MLENRAASPYAIFFNAIIAGKGMTLIYNMPAQEDRSFNIMLQQLNESGKWSQALLIDRCYPLSNDLYQIQAVSPEHMLLFYQGTTGEKAFGYREVTSLQTTDFHTISTMSGNLADHSILTTNNAIHAAFIIRGMFSHTLIYKKKESGHFSNPLIIYEAPKLTDLCLFIVKNNLHLTFISGGQLFMTVSYDNGNTFTKAARYRSKFCMQPIKSFYLSEGPQNEKNFFLRELYTDILNPCDIQLLPELYEEFYPLF
jgi:hypothetical protein